MVKYQPAALDATFGALADPTRRAILARLATGETSVTSLAEPFRISLPAISKHLGVLERAGLIHRRRQGRVRRCRLAAGPMKDAAAWITRYRRFWERQFDALAEYLHTTTAEENTAWPPPPPAPPRSGSGAPSRRRRNGSSGRGRTRKR